MKIFKVVNQFNMSRYFISAKSEERMLDIIDEHFLKELAEITADEGQYDDLRESREERIDRISYEVVMEDASKEGIEENEFDGDEWKYSY